MSQAAENDRETETQFVDRDWMLESIEYLPS
jgi:hypothetical protein